MEYLNMQSLYMPFMTAIGAISLFPDPPKIFKDLAKNEIVKWIFVWVLIMQGGAGGNVQLAIVMTALLFAFVKVLDMVYTKKESYYSY